MMKFIDLQKQYKNIQPSIDASIKAVIEHGQFIDGPEVSALEHSLAKYTGVKHCIVNSSGTAALQVTLMALGIKSGDEIVTTPFSFFAPVEVTLFLGAKPVFVDIDPLTYNLDPQKLEAAITKNTKAIIPVSLFGQCADFDKINEIAKKYNIPVIEDAAQSFGASYKGRSSCALTEIACASFFPSKPLGCYGEGGACFTNNDELAHKMRMIIHHGSSKRYHHELVGMNGRLPSIQAAILLAKLAVFDEELEKRQQVAKWYNEALGNMINPPYIAPYNKSVYAQYTIQILNRDEIQKTLNTYQIPTAVHYPKGLHQQPVVQNKIDTSQHFLNTEQAAENVLSLPFHPYMSQAEVEQVTKALENSLKLIAV